MPGPIAPRNRLFLPRGYQKRSRLVVDKSDPINQSVAGRWPLGDVINGGSPDASGQSPPAVVQGGPLTYAASHHGGQAVSLSGSAQYLSVAQNGLIIGKNTFTAPSQMGTWCCWVKTNSLNGGQPTVLALCSTSSTFGINVSLNNPSGTVQAISENAGLVLNLNSTTSVTDNVWHFIVFVWTMSSIEGTCGLYIDGKLEASGAPSGGWNFNIAPPEFRIGKSADTFWKAFLGSIEGVGIWNRQLSDHEIKRLYAEPYAGLYAANRNLVGIASAGANVNLSGVSATAAVGSFGYISDDAVGLVGAHANAAAGSFAVSYSNSVALAGVGTFASAGAFTPSVSSVTALTGVSATADIGVLTPSSYVDLFVPIITIMNADPIPADGEMVDDDVPVEADLPYQIAFEAVLNTNPIPMTGSLSPGPVPGEGSVP